MAIRPFKPTAFKRRLIVADETRGPPLVANSSLIAGAVFLRSASDIRLMHRSSRALVLRGRPDLGASQKPPSLGSFETACRTAPAETLNCFATSRCDFLLDHKVATIIARVIGNKDGLGPILKIT